MSYCPGISCRQLIPLLHPYMNILAIDPADNEFLCQDTNKTIISALYILNNGAGNTVADIADKCIELCPSVTYNDVETALSLSLKRGLFRSLRPYCIDWCSPLPDTKYTFSESMDRYPINRSYVEYLIALTGGITLSPTYGTTGGISVQSTFYAYFLPYPAPTYSLSNGCV